MAAAICASISTRVSGASTPAFYEFFLFANTIPLAHGIRPTPPL